jgi:hypothetical protein
LKKSSLLLAIVTAFSAFGVNATPAFAGPPPTPQSACGADDYNYVDTSTGYTFTRASGNNASVSGDAGVTLTISTSTTFTVGGTIASNSQVSASIVIMTVSQALNISLTASISRTSTNSGAWTVPASYTNGGRLEIGARKYNGVVTKYRAKPSDCSNGTYISSASYNAPDDGWYFKHTQL